MADTTGSGSTLDDLAAIFGNMAAARGSGRFQQATAQNDYDRNATSLYNSQQNAAKLGLEAPGYLAGQSARGDLLANLQPVSFSGLPDHIHVPTVSGGLTPAALGPNARAAGASLSAQSLDKLGNPGSYMPTAPTQTPLPQGNWADTALQGGAAGAGILGALLGGGGPGGSGSGGNVSQLAKDLAGLFKNPNNPNNFTMKPGDGFGGDHTSTFGSHDPFAGNLPGFNDGDWNNPAVGNTGMPNNPSGGTGVGPGMAEYYAWLAQQQNQPDQGSSGGSNTGSDWWDE